MGMLSASQIQADRICVLQWNSSLHGSEDPVGGCGVHPQSRGCAFQWQDQRSHAGRGR